MVVNGLYALVVNAYDVRLNYKLYDKCGSKNIKIKIKNKLDAKYSFFNLHTIREYCKF